MASSDYSENSELELITEIDRSKYFSLNYELKLNV
jgi:hypothetical protein